MNGILAILIAMLSVYGFFTALCEIKRLLLRLARRPQKKIDKDRKKEYNNTHTD